MDIHLAIIGALVDKLGIPMLRDPASQDFREMRARLRQEILEAFALPAHLCSGKGGGMVERIVVPKVYLGDAVYCAVNEAGQFILTTEDGISASNTIYMEDEVVEAFALYVKRARAELKRRRDVGEDI